MRETVHIRLGEPAPSALVAYAVTSVEPPVSVLVREAPLAEVIALCAGKRVLLYAPAHDVRLLSASIPVKQAAKALAAAPYALEDQFAEDVESLHFAIAPAPVSGSEWALAVVAHSHMKAWLAPFTAAGITPEALVPETLALPWTGNERWTALAEPGHLTVRTGRMAGFGCLEEDFELFMGLAEGDTKKPLRMLVTQGVATDFTRFERDIELLPGLEHPLQALARNYSAAASINLLQGPYLARQGLAREWQVWKVAAGLFGIAFALGAIGNGISAIQLGREASRQQAANEQRFRELFPTEQRIVNLRAQAEQQFAALNGGASSAGLMPLLEALGGGMKAAPSLQLQGMQFREGALFISLSGSDLSALDQLRNHYGSGSATKLDVQSANAGDGGVQIRIKLSLS